MISIENPAKRTKSSPYTIFHYAMTSDYYSDKFENSLVGGNNGPIEDDDFGGDDGQY